MLVDQTGTWHVAHKCICSARFMLSRIVLYCFSLLKMYCIHPWFGISICSVLKVFVVEYFISVTLQAKEIKKYIVKAFPRYVSNQRCTSVFGCVGTARRVTKPSQAVLVPGNSDQDSEFMKTSAESPISPFLFSYYELRTLRHGAIWKNSRKKQVLSVFEQDGLTELSSSR